MKLFTTRPPAKRYVMWRVAKNMLIAAMALLSIPLGQLTSSCLVGNKVCTMMPENTMFFVNFELSGITLFYPALALFYLSEDPKRFTKGRWGQTFYPCLVAWILWLLFAVPQIITSLIYDTDPGNAKNLVEAYQMRLESFWSNLQFSAVTLLICILCFAVIIYHLNFYKKLEMLAAGEIK